MTVNVAIATTECVVGCRVLAASALRVEADALPALRKQPGPPGTATPAALLKHADEQTVVALAAVHRALAQLPAATMTPDWGVVVAPNFFGRGGIALGFQRYRREGAWGISPHIIPHTSLHAPSGTISQALGLHGPNFGVGGGPDSSGDAFLTAATLLAEPTCPGLWLVLTGFTAEALPPDGEATPLLPTCEAVALALVPATMATTAGPSLSLRVCPHDEGESSADFLAALPTFRLGLLVEELTLSERAPAALWRLGATGWIELEALR